MKKSKRKPEKPWAWAVLCGEEEIQYLFFSKPLAVAYLKSERSLRIKAKLVPLYPKPKRKKI